MIYADHAATAPLAPAALEAMLPLLETGYGNPSSLYTFGQRAKAALEHARKQVAASLGAHPQELFFTSGGTESDNWALTGVANAQKHEGKHIITSAVEHHAVLYTAQYLEKQGFEVTYLLVNEYGMVSPDSLRSALRPDTILVSVMTANNEVGTIQPIKELAEIAHEGGALFHTDAVQAVGHIPLNVGELGVDLLSLSGHKFGGPKGMGALYVRKGTPLAPLLHGGGQERTRRSGTENVAGAAGMAAALIQATAGMAEECARLTVLRDKLVAGLSTIPRVWLNGHPTLRLPGNVSFTFEGISGESLVLLLDEMGICASSGSACTSNSLGPSHVLLAIGQPYDMAYGSLRLTLGLENTEADVDEILRAVKTAVAHLRSASPLTAVSPAVEKQDLS